MTKRDLNVTITINLRYINPLVNDPNEVKDAVRSQIMAVIVNSGNMGSPLVIGENQQVPDYLNVKASAILHQYSE